MKPAVCFICGRLAIDEPVDNKGEWLKFADYKNESLDSFDHPTGLEYVCFEHKAAAKKLINNTSEKVRLELHSKYNVSDKSQYQKQAPHSQSLWHKLSNIFKR